MATHRLLLCTLVSVIFILALVPWRVEGLTDAEVDNLLNLQASTRLFSACSVAVKLTYIFCSI